MKKILPGTVVITILLLVSLALFVTGQKHKVIVDNKTIEISGKTYTKLPLVAVSEKLRPDIDLFSRVLLFIYFLLKGQKKYRI